MPPGGRPSLRDAQRTLTRNRLLDAAVEVMCGRSTLDVTMEEIARTAGVTRATLYAHFPTKTDLVRALAARLYAIGDEVYDDLAARPRWTRTELRRWLDAVARRWDVEAPSVRVLTLAGPSLAVEDGVDAHERYVSVLTADTRRWHGEDPARARQRVMMFLLQIESFFTVWVSSDRRVFQTDDPLDLLTDVLCFLLAPALAD